MRIILAQNSPYEGVHGGANKANRCIMRLLHARGFDCLVVCPRGDAGHAAPAGPRDLVTLTNADGVAVHAVRSAFDGPRHLATIAGTFDPAWIIVAEDPGQFLLEAALAVRGRVAYMARNTLSLPFGHGCFRADPARTRLFAKAAAIVANSRWLAAEVRAATGQDALVLDVPDYGDPPFPRYGRAERGFVTLINPCAIKGLTLFTAMAAARPDLPFAAVPTWGTTAADLTALARVPNITILPASADIDTVLARTRVLVMPSLWHETFGRMAIEAMLRGIPVLASDCAGLPEAKLGVPYLLPVVPIREYPGTFDERGLPVPIVPGQDDGPWLAALDDLLRTPGRYAGIAEWSAAAAAAYVSGLTIDPLADLLAVPVPAC